MSGISGFSNQKKLGGAQFASVQGTGSDKFGINTAQMYLFDITPSAIAITGVTQDPVISDKVWLEVVSHGAKVGDVVRFPNNADALFGWELDVVEVLDANTLAVHNISFINNVPTLPTVGEMVKTCRWVTAKADSEGALTTSSGPAQFIKNGATQTVAQDTVTPANNNPLPAGLYIIKDGVVVPVLKDTGLPSNTVGIPVEVVAASGTPINITAGDLNVQLSDQGVNFDSLRVGDGSGVYLLVNADGSINVNDAAVLAAINQMNTDINLNIDDLNTAVSSLQTEVTNRQDLSNNSLDAIEASTASMDTKFTTLNSKDFSTAANQTALASLTGPVTETAPATDTASSGLNGRLQRVAQRLTSLIALLPTSIGQKTKAASLAIVPPSDYQFPVMPYGVDLAVNAVAANNADIVTAVDVTQYKVIYIQNLNSFSATVQFQGSMDNSNWVSVVGSPVSASVIVSNSMTQSLLLWAVPVTFKYFRLRTTAYTSGTINVLAYASSIATADYATKYFQPNGTITTANSAVAGTVSAAQVTVGTTAVRATVAGTAPNANRKLLLIKPSATNAGKIFFGPSTVTTANGMEILGPDRVEFDFDAGDYYLISDTAGQTVEILEKI